MKRVSLSSPSFVNGVCNFTFRGETNDSSEAEEFLLEAGKYKFEVWGAKGGDGFLSNILRNGGAGGYSSGEISFQTPTTIFAFVGGSGLSVMTSGSVPGGFNGGGYNADSRGDFRKGSGGGASDIRIGNSSLFHRVIVGGGGGGGNAAGTGGAANGGVGGGITGGKSPGHYSSTEDHSFCDGSGGSQTNGGVMGTASHSGTYKNTAPQPNGTFGFGGNIEGNNIMGGSGGGGWYGGGSGNGHGGAGGGGSGYTLNSSTIDNVPPNYQLGSEFFMSSCLTLSGDDTFLSPYGYLFSGNHDHGYIRITIISTHSQPISTSISTKSFICYSGPSGSIFMPQLILIIITAISIY